MGRYKYKAGMVASVLLALVVTYISVRAMFGSVSGEGPNVGLHVGLFMVALVAIVVAIYFRYKDNTK